MRQGLVFFLGWICWAPVSLSVTDASTYKLLAHFSEAFRKIRDSSAIPLSEEELISGAIQGMLDQVDQRSTYLAPHVYQNLKTHVEGSFGGVGMEVTQNGRLFVITKILEEGPAHKAGLSVGEQILEINDDDLRAYELEEVVQLLKGPKGEKVRLKIRNQEGVSRTTVLKKDRVTLKPLSYRRIGQILYVRLESFNTRNTTELMKEALKKMQKETGKLRGIILDLRGNKGGLFDQAIDVSNLFLESNEITSVRGRNPQDAKRYMASKGTLFKGVPMVALVDGETASSAEIVAAALKAHKRAYLMGEKTLGKGSVQTVIPLEGNGGALNLTTHHYYTPDGKNIDQNGILPHSESRHARQDALIEDAVAYLEGLNDS